MSDSSGEIIIKGGSCEITFDHDHFPLVVGEDRKRKHNSLEIKRIIISDDPLFDDYDSDEHEVGFKGTIRVIYS
jgi:hypothetical protein